MSFENDSVNFSDGSESPNLLAVPFLEYFEDMGCRVDLDSTYRKLYNIDFGISRIRGVHAAVNMGLHLTRDTESFSKQEIFLEAARRGVVAKSLYIEVCSRPLETGVIPIAHIASLSFLFDRRYHHTKAIGLRIFEDNSFHFFDLEENVRRLRKHIHDAAHEDSPILDGQVVAYFSDKGFGFIEDEGQQKFFFHIANVMDERLRQMLPNYMQEDIIPVRFSYGGSDGKKYPKAIEVGSDHEAMDSLLESSDE